MIWFTSDQHFGHANVIKYCNRPFLSVDEMNAVIIARHNDRVKATDTVYHLGDFSMSKDRVKEILPKLNGTHILIAGNHDHCHPIHAKKPEKEQRMREFYREAGFVNITLRAAFDFDGTFFILDHMPYHSDHTKDVRYANWRPADNGNWLLHGHVHELWKTKGRMINVGVDVWDFKPASIEQIMEIVRAMG